MIFYALQGSQITQADKNIMKILTIHNSCKIRQNEIKQGQVMGNHDVVNPTYLFFFPKIKGHIFDLSTLELKRVKPNPP